MSANIYNFTPKYMTKDGEPWFPLMGEFHYSRYPKEFWRESIYKMKAGGIEIVSAYVFWIHHEERKGEYDFTGQRDLRAFVETVKECGLELFIRVGPWCHGEVRNGGLPDWILKEDYEVRTNDERYFAEVEKYYAKVFEQVKGYLYKDGGPIVGMQIENEYGHCGGLQGEEGERHMRRLTSIAKTVGFDVPYYTATGWGGAVTGGLLPVMGGYCEAPWDQRITVIEPSGNYVFTHERNDHNIGSDYGFGTGITYDIDKFPFLTAELGGGMQVTHHRRPIATAKDIGAMSMVKLGCGVNLLGYYMYHGGTNPKGKLTTLQESTDTGYLNNLPVLSYDFRAPVREYGQMSDTLKEIKLITMFIQSFGRELCEMETYLPESNSLFQTNLKDLRSSVRRNKNKGYLFVNNYQRSYVMKDHKQEVLKAELEDEVVEYPPIDIYNQDFFFLPFNMTVGDGELKTALATPLCTLDTTEGNTYVFYSHVEPSLDWMREPKDTKVITLSREDAINSWKMRLEKEHLVISKGEVIEHGQGYELITRHNDTIKVYPPLKQAPAQYEYIGMEEEFAVYQCKEAQLQAMTQCHIISESRMKKVYEIQIDYPDAIHEVSDCFLQINYGGDIGKLFIDGEWEGDWFYQGDAWEIGLKRFGFPKKVTIEIEGLEEGAPIFLEQWPSFVDGVACDIYHVAVEVERKYQI